MEIKELIEMDRQGLIPGPGESDRDFEERAAETKAAFLGEGKRLVPRHHWDWANEQLQGLFGFSPRWVSALYSSEGLAPWQAAATWIDAKRIYSIQIRSSRWLSRLIDPNEVLAHEAVHAARAAFDEPKNEEMFAYLTSSDSWRKVLGPIFKEPKEAAILLSLLCLGSFASVLEGIWDMPLSAICFSAAAFLGAAWLARLFFTRMRMNRAARVLKEYLQENVPVRWVLFRLTDAEIACFAERKKLNRSEEPRWRLLRAAYFTKKANEELWLD